jgi:uncharacterized protein with von Willebrand factor type A (vWA) domain
MGGNILLAIMYRRKAIKKDFLTLAGVSRSCEDWSLNKLMKV